MTRAEENAIRLDGGVVKRLAVMGCIERLADESDSFDANEKREAQDYLDSFRGQPCSGECSCIVGTNDADRHECACGYECCWVAP